MVPIAIVGCGCIVPGAKDVSTFERNLFAGKVSLGPVPAPAWDHSLHFHPDRTLPDRAYCDLGGFVSDFCFDWRRFKVPPADAELVNPMQWMILEAGAQALGEVKRIPNETASVIIGSTGLGWQKDSGLRIRLDDMLDAVRGVLGELPEAEAERIVEEASRRLTARLKDVSEDNVVGASASVAAGRINMCFDLKGPHCSIDAGFASSLAALDLAARGLTDGEFDLAVAGGASELLSPLEFIAFSKLGGISGTGIFPFDERADGTILGEGVVLFALKRLDDAQRDGDTVHAVLLGVGGASDGRHKSLLAPRWEGQAMAMRRALADCDGGPIDPATVRYIECHATGTQLGDASEVRALSSVYGGQAAGSVALGSVKANVGHLRSAAGAAGLLKAVLSLRRGEIPPQASFARANPKLELETTPFYVPTSATVFPGSSPPRAAVSSFSFGGSSYHAVLEAFRPEAPSTARRPPRASRAEPLAIIGMGGAFPGADRVPDFWSRLREGYNRTQEVPPSRWDINRYHDPTGNRLDKSYSKIGCFLDELPVPPASMRIPPSSAASVDPSHLLAFNVAEEALHDAGWAPGKWDPDRVALSLAFLPYQGKKFLADIRVNWREFEKELRAVLSSGPLPPSRQEALVLAAEDRFKAGLPPINEDTLPGYLGSLNAGRIAWAFDFHGPHYVIDAACASALAALQAAVAMLRHRQADVVLSGGVWCDMQPEFFVAACRFNALSAEGSFPFDARAAGFIPGEGAGVLVLKRLADAERDKDRIHAVLRAVAGASDGCGRSVLAPSQAGEALAMKRAIALAAIPASSVDYVETHGTGTALGDVVEAKACSDAYGEGRTAPLLIGSLKSNIGHLNAAAGAAGLIKAALCVEQGELPASINCKEKNPKIPPGVDVVRERRGWPGLPAGQPRRAGVSAFGVGGANYHAIVEQYLGAAGGGPSAAQPPPAAGSSHPPGATGPAALLAFAGASERDCLQAAEKLAGELAAGERPFADLAAGAPAPGGEFRLALTARSPDELSRKCQALRQAVEDGRELDFLGQQGVFLAGPTSPLRGAKVAVLFPGQGGQYPNMLRSLAAAYPPVARTIAEADQAYQALAGRPITASFFTEDPEHYRQPDEDIHAAVFTVNVALFQILQAHGIRPAFFIGQSAGELAALVAAGSLSLADGLRLVRSRTLAVLELGVPDPGHMLALTCSAQDASELLRDLSGYATLAADNGPRACIVSADGPTSDQVVHRCQQAGIECTVLAVSHGYHSKIIEGARGPYLGALQQATFHPPGPGLISTIDGKPYGDRPPSEFPAYLASQLVTPVYLRKALLCAHEAGARVFLEAGPKWGLSQFARETLDGKPHAAIPSIHPKVGEVDLFKRLIAFCFVHHLGNLVPESPMHEPALSVSSAVATPTVPPQIEEIVLKAVMAKTRYPREMLGLNLDLEADLGIDTVKQIDIFAAAREQVGLEKDPSFVVRNHNTLFKFIAYLVARLASEKGAARPPAVAPAASVLMTAAVAATPAPAVSASRAAAPLQVPPSPAAARGGPAPRPDGILLNGKAAGASTASSDDSSARAKRWDPVKRVVTDAFKAKTRYPEEMLGLDLDLEADLGIDTVKQLDILAAARTTLGLERDERFVLRDHNTLRKAIQYFVDRLGGAASAAPEQRASAPRPPPAPAAVPPRPQAPIARQPSLGEALQAAASAPQEESEWPSSIRAVLLSLDLREELGFDDAQKRRIAAALSSRLQLSEPNRDFKTLGQLLRILAGD